MPKWFNTAGPCQSDIHYMLSPTARLPEVTQMIEQRSYFVLHAPRQVGKTTAMIALGQEPTASGAYTAVMVSAEVGAAFPDDVGKAEDAMLGVWRSACEARLPTALLPPPWPEAKPGERISAALKAWAKASPRPLVLFIDEIDALQNEVLISVLRQIRDGYPNRPQEFPQSIALIGLRDVRDYKVASGGSEKLGTSSPFNIKVRSIKMRDFTFDEMVELYQQHQDYTGQQFTPEALNYAYELTNGQPWLVNALVKVIIEDMKVIETITLEHFHQAKEILIERNDTHLDSLAERLKENRIRRILEPMLAGEDLGEIPQEDLQFIVDLGLCRLDPMGGVNHC